MTWWRERSQSTSWSLVSLTTCLAMLCVLGVWNWAPKHVFNRLGIEQVRPGLLTVAPPARGEITLGQGYTAGMYASGLHVSEQDATIIDSLTGGSFLAAIEGSVADRHESIDRARTNVQIDSVTIGQESATWRGTVYAKAVGDGLPLTVTAQRVDDQVRVRIVVPGADALFLQADVRSNTVGVAPQLPARNLRQQGWWVTGQGSDVFSNYLGAHIGLEPGTVPRAVDLRPDGYLSMHVWSDSLSLVLERRPQRPGVATTPTVGS